MFTNVKEMVTIQKNVKTHCEAIIHKPGLNVYDGMLVVLFMRLDLFVNIFFELNNLCKFIQTKMMMLDVCPLTHP